MQTNLFLLTLTIAAPALTPVAALASACEVPAGFVVPPVPPVDPPAHARLARTVESSIDVPARRFHAWFMRAPLADLLPGTRDLPRVTGTAPIGTLAFPAPGSVRYVCLADGSAAIEKVLVNDGREHFAYQVWGYSLPAAQGVSYGYGEFALTDLDGRTGLRWTYSFKLKEDRFPGSFGPLGRYLFRKSFLDSKYAGFMQAGMAAIKQGAERTLRP